jgi:SAM-dependent methyltransferase
VPGEDSTALWRRVARQTQGEDYAHRYATRFDELAASGQDTHGEAELVTRLVPAGARVLDAGCGTGRVAQRLHELGYDAIGVDFDEAMIEVALERSPDITWHVADLALLDLGVEFDLIVAAGNVVPLAGAAALPAIVHRLARHLRLGGLLVSGFGLDSAHLPPGGVTPVSLTTYDSACAGAGLSPGDRWADWQGTPYDGGGYAVSVHRLPADATDRDPS